MTIALLFSLGTCIVQIQNVRVNFACTKRLFNLLADAIINVRNAILCARCAIFPLKIKHIPFFCRLAKGFTFLKRAKNQFKMLLEMCFVLASFVATEGNASLWTVMSQLLDPFVVVESVEPGCLFTKIFLCYKRQEHVKTTKTDKTRCFFV